MGDVLAGWCLGTAVVAATAIVLDAAPHVFTKTHKTGAQLAAPSLALPTKQGEA